MSPPTNNGGSFRLEIRLLGTPEVLYSGKPVRIASHKAMALLAYLAAGADEQFSRDHLAGLLWEESANEQARANLRQTLSQLRRAFREAGHDPIVTQADRLVLRSDGVSIDILQPPEQGSSVGGKDSEFQEREFLEGFSIPEAQFENWMTTQREKLRMQSLHRHQSMAEQSYRSKRFDNAIVHLTYALHLDPLQEHVHRRLMELFVAQGRIDAALAQFERCQSVLQRELNIAPDKNTIALYRSILRKRSNDQQKDVHVPQLPSVARSDLPTDLEIPEKPSIAVLALTNMSGDPDQEYFSDGLSEDIITELSKLSGLFVIARNSTFNYKNTQIDVKQVSRELGVRYLLEGSVRKAGERVRITAQLIDGVTGGHLWAERYDRELTDIFSVQDEVTDKIVTALAPKLSAREQQRAQRQPTKRLAAYDYFLRGRQHALMDSKDDNQYARRLLEKAIELDPEFSMAFAHLARNHVLSHINRWDDAPDRQLETAIELGQKAIQLDESNPFAHFALATAVIWAKEIERAELEARTTMTLDPNFADGHAALGMIMIYAGKPEQSMTLIRAAMRLDPHYRDIFLHLLALACFHTGQYQDAITALKRRLIRKPESDISRVLLAAAHGHLDQIQQSRTAWAEMTKINPDYSLEHRREVLPYKDPADFEHIVQGLRKAELPEA